MNETQNCPQCRERLEIPVDMLGQPVRCGTCSHVFTPHQSLYHDDARPAREPRRSNPAATAATRRVVMIVLGALALFALLCCGGFGYLFFAVTNPSWKPYDSQTGEFTVKFPGTARADTRQTGRLNNETATVILANRKMFQEDYFVYFISLTDRDQRHRDEVIDALADGLLTQYPGSSEYRPRVPRQHAGHEAMDVCLELIDDRYLTGRIVMTDDKAYVVAALSPGDPDGKPWVEEFVDSFQPKVPVQAAPGNGNNPFRKQ